MGNDYNMTQHEFFDFIQKILTGQKDIECEHKCSCAKSKEESAQQEEDTGEEQEIIINKDVVIPFPCGGEMSNLKAVYNKQTNKMAITFEFEEEVDNIKITGSQEIYLDCSNVNLDVSSIDLEQDGDDVVLFTADFEKKKHTNVEFL